MTTYKTQFSFAELTPSAMDWGFDDDIDVKENLEIFSSPFSPGQYPHSQLAAPQMTFTGDHISPLFANLHVHSDSFHQSCPGQVPNFPPDDEFMPWHYQMGQALHPTQQLQFPQFNHDMRVAYHQPESPVSDIVKPDQDYFHYLHSTPIFLPPTSFLLSPSPILYNQFPSPDNPLIKQEEEGHTDRASEGLISPSPTAPEPTEESQGIAMDDEGGNESDRQYVAVNYSDERPLAIPLAIPLPSGKDIDCDKTAPYAVLIYRALMSSPRRRMVLADIYKYFREKIPRFRKMKGRGWMNSIRHNLSMNGAFLKVNRPFDDPGKGYIWVLSDEAIRDGVKSTTRYRKSPPNSKKRAADDAFLRGSTSKRRRKSTRKRTTVKSRSYAQAIAITKIKNTHHEKGPTPPPTPPPPHNTPAPPSTEVQFVGLIDYSSNVGGAHEYRPIDYTNCYASFPHFGASSVLYDSEDENWRLCGSGDQFSEEYTLVTQTQNQRLLPEAYA